MSIRIGSKRRAIIDEYGEAHAEFAKATPAKKTMDRLRPEIVAWLIGEGADQTFVLEGQRFDLQITEQAKVAIVDYPSVFRHVGAERFFVNCEVSVKALKLLLDGETFEELVHYERTGARQLKPLARAIPLRQAS